MAISRNQKEALIKELLENAMSQKAVVLLNSEGKEAMDAASNFELRNGANQNGVTLKIVKNTLVKRLLDDAEGDIPEFTGQTYMAYSLDSEKADEVSVPKAIVSLVAKDFKNNLKVLGAVVNGQFLDSETAIQLSKTPSKDESIATLAGMLSRLAGGTIATLLNDNASKIARSIAEVAKTKTA